MFPGNVPLGWRVSITVSCIWLWEGQRHWLRHTARKTHGWQTRGARGCAHRRAIIGSANASQQRVFEPMTTWGLNNWPVWPRCQLFLLSLGWHCQWAARRAQRQTQNTACQQSSAVHLGDAMPHTVPLRDRGRERRSLERKGVRRGYLKTNPKL